MNSLENKIAAVTAILTAGKLALGNSNYAESIRLFREGIAILGNEYYRPETIEHTGERLALAEFEEKSGRLEVAVSLLLKVLEARLAMHAAERRSYNVD